MKIVGFDLFFGFPLRKIRVGNWGRKMNRDLGNGLGSECPRVLLDPISFWVIHLTHLIRDMGCPLDPLGMGLNRFQISGPKSTLFLMLNINLIN